MDNGPSQPPHSPTEELPWPPASQLLPHPLVLASGRAQQEQLSPPQMHLLPAALCPCCRRLIYWPYFSPCWSSRTQQCWQVCISSRWVSPIFTLWFLFRVLREHSPWPEAKRNVSEFGAFGCLQCLYPKRASRELRKDWRPRVALGLPNPSHPGKSSRLLEPQSRWPRAPPTPLACRNGWTQLHLALKMKLPLSLNTPSPVTSPMAGKEKKTFSPSGPRPILPDKGALIQRGGLLLGASLSGQIPGSLLPLQPVSNWIHE